MRRRLALDRLVPHTGVPATKALAAFFIPGLGVQLRSPGLLGQAALGVAALLVVVFFIWLGRPLATIAFTLLLSLHCTAILYLFQPFLFSLEFRSRMMACFAALLLLGCLVYLPARNILQDHFFMPLHVRGRVMIMNRLQPPTVVKRGDLLVYRVEASRGAYAGVVVHEGYGYGAVLALPGDELTFSESSYTINGVSHPRLPHMPGDGSALVPPDTWFIWPELDITRRGNVGEGTVVAGMYTMAFVPKENYLGRAFNRWFFWKQL